MVPAGMRAPAGMTALEKMVRQARALRIHRCLLRVPRIRRNRGDHSIWALSSPEKIDKTAWPAENKPPGCAVFCFPLISVPPDREQGGDLEEWEDKIPRYGIVPGRRKTEAQKRYCS